MGLDAVSVVQSTYGPTRPTPKEHSIWLVVRDPPGTDDPAALDGLRKRLEAVVKKTVEEEVDGNRRPRPKCRVSSGAVESEKLRIFVKAL